MYFGRDFPEKPVAFFEENTRKALVFLYLFLKYK
jgi:hypothetical protein